MQCRLNGITLNDVPKFLLKISTVNDHALIIPPITDDSLLRISFKLQGITSYFPVQAATLMSMTVMLS